MTGSCGRGVLDYIVGRVSPPTVSRIETANDLYTTVTHIPKEHLSIKCPSGKCLVIHSPSLRPTSWSRPIAPWAHSHLMGLLPSPMPQALCVTSPRSFWHLGPGFPGVRCHICLPNPASMGLVYPTTRTCSAIPVLWHIKVITEVSQMNRAKRGILQIQNKYPMSIANEY